jgi:hypothetical protein
MRLERERRAPADEVPRGEHWRTRVEYDDDWSLTTVAEERVTSSNPGAQVLAAETLELTDEAIRWLHAALGDVLALRGRTGRAELPELAIPGTPPSNDVDYVTALEIVARNAKNALDAVRGDGTSGVYAVGPEDVAAAVGGMEEALARLARIQSRVVPIRSPVADGEVA